MSFYPIDPRGLAVFDTPIDARPPGPLGTRTQPPTVTEDAAQLRGRLDMLRDLASATDGAMTETNDLVSGMKKIADDLSEYYLLGYNSTNAKLDGRFRKITVRVNRPGVLVRARRGYLAVTEAEVAARTAALGALGTAHIDRAVRLAAGYEWLAAAGTLASLAPGDYLIEITLGGGASRQTMLTAIRMVP